MLDYQCTIQWRINDQEKKFLKVGSTGRIQGGIKLKHVIDRLQRQLIYQKQQKNILKPQLNIPKQPKQIIQKLCQFMPLLTMNININTILFNSLRSCVLLINYSYEIISKNIQNLSITIINPINYNKYQLNYNDIQSIYLKSSNHMDMDHVNHVYGQQNNKFQQKTIDKQDNNVNKNVIVIKKLFQRLILLKLFHEIPKGVYSYSMELVEVQFQSEQDLNLLLYLINRTKLQRNITYNQNNQNNQDIKISNNNNNNNNNNNTIKTGNLSRIQHKRSLQQNISERIQFKHNLNSLVFKQKSNNANNINKNNSFLSNASININNTNNFSNNKEKSSRGSFLYLKDNHNNNNNNSINNKTQQKQPYPLNNNSNQPYIDHSNNNINILIKKQKQPKISILSTQITSIKGLREQKSSFPEHQQQLYDRNNNNIAYCEVKPHTLQKPNFLSLTSNIIRRSVQQLKTPRNNENMYNFGEQLSLKKKSCSNIQQLSKQQQIQNNRINYVNQFENLLYQDNQNNQELCLNQSFNKFQEIIDEENGKDKRREGSIQAEKYEINKQICEGNRNIVGQIDSQPINRVLNASYKNIASNNNNINNNNNKDIIKNIPYNATKIITNKERQLFYPSLTVQQKTIQQLKLSIHNLLKSNRELALTNSLYSEQINGLKIKINPLSNQDTRKIEDQLINIKKKEAALSKEVEELMEKKRKKNNKQENEQQNKQQNKQENIIKMEMNKQFAGGFYSPARESRQYQYNSHTNNNSDTKYNNLTVGRSSRQHSSFFRAKHDKIAVNNSININNKNEARKLDNQKGNSSMNNMNNKTNNFLRLHQNTDHKLIFGRGQLSILGFEGERVSQKFRTNQSYSFKPTNLVYSKPE